MPPGNAPVVMVGGGATVMDKGCVAVAPLRLALSVTTATKLKVPIALGVPLITPVPEFSVMPVGSEPVMDHAYGGVPPLVVNV